MKMNNKLRKTIKDWRLHCFNILQTFLDKLSRREKFLLIALLGLVVFILYYQLVISTNYKKVVSLKEQLRTVTAQYEKIKQDIDPDNPIHSRYKSTYAKTLFLTEDLFTNFEQERIILLLDEILKASGLSPTNISFKEPEIVPLGEEKAEEQQEKLTVLDAIVKQYFEGNNINPDDNEKEKSEEEGSSSNEIEKMEIQIQYKSTYNVLKSFLKQVEAHPKRIMISNLDIAVDPETGHIMGNIVLNLFYVPSFALNEQLDKEWPHDNLYGKGNPFIYHSNTSITYSPTVQNSKAADDFIITVKPFTADLPTVMIAKTKDREMKTHVYADNEGIEPVEFQILKEGDRYFYKYKTQKESYPTNYAEEKIEFNPEGSVVNIHILSNERNSQEDKSGMRLSLINKSDLECIVKVDYEDPNRKRVHIDKTFGKVTIID